MVANFICKSCGKSFPDATIHVCRYTFGSASPVRTVASTPQPPPEPGRERVLDRVLRDLTERAEFGKQKYGTYLYTDNGRDALVDAYHEAADLLMYLGQLLMEREGK